MKTQEKRYCIAVQKDGKLKDTSLLLLEKMGLKVPADLGRKLTYRSTDVPLDIIFLRNRDIPTFVHNGSVDFAIVGEDVLSEAECDVDIVAKCNFGDCTLSIAVPKDSGIKNAKQLVNKRIATSYPNALTKYLTENNIDASVVTLRGGSEVAPFCGFADAVCEIVQTGETLVANDLEVLETIFSSTATLIKKKSISDSVTSALFGPVIKYCALNI
ncbi:MAG: ATP phosphoribosyltransferase [Candidatus Pacebacteria bacterium]|nr:ATP phosphoribosyltransferase [Candidatus Paceibacterota bacterium]